MADASDAHGRRVLVAVPALNESKTVASVVAAITRSGVADQILVVDDGSTDSTATVAAAQGAQVLKLPFNVGVGGAMRAAFLYARENDFDVVIQVDADGQHEPDRIADLLAASSDASIVIGARFAGEGDYGVSAPRRLAMWMLARSLSRVTRTTLTDVTSGFRLSDRRAIELFARHYPAEYLGDTVESLVIAARAGLPVAQVPVAMQPRQGGDASQNPITASLYLGRAALALLVALSRRRGAPPSGLDRPKTSHPTGESL